MINDINRQSNGIVVAIDLERSTFEANNRVYGIGGGVTNYMRKELQRPIQDML